MSLEFLGGGGAAPSPRTASASEMANLFSQACVEPKGEHAAVSQVAARLGLSAQASNAPGGKGAAKLMLLATGPGVVVSQTDGILEYGFVQCNATFYTTALPTSDEVELAMKAAFGRPADNEGERVKPNGKPNKGYSPRWNVTGANGSAMSAEFHVMKSNNYMPGDRVLFGLREAAEKKTK
ncbi:MAG: hypothetical protein Q8R44_06560 [Novosphingobium sp.]|nr:hypothetical protein [Novosphingobium sp.]